MKSMIRCITFLLCLLPVSVYGWDAVGHRLSVAVALNFLDEDKTDQLLAILAQHPRYQEDFVAQMPAFVRSDPTLHAEWLLGQAAYWPDIARGLPDAERERYNHPDWHFTDGAWVRGSAPVQGNVYVGIDALPDIPGEEGSSIRSEDQVHNVVTALDYNSYLLADESRPGAERAIALCWMLHLAGDIHQPLHTGSLYSGFLFVTGDRGGNGIPTGRNDNLHLSWDRALQDEGVAESLPLILEQVGGFGQTRIVGSASNWTSWMSESRQLLQSVVYTENMKGAIAAADRGQGDLRTVILNRDYIARMQRYARQRIGLAGVRLAHWFESELP